MVVLPLQGSQTDLVKKRFEIDPGKQAVINYTGIDGDISLKNLQNYFTAEDAEGAEEVNVNKDIYNFSCSLTI